MTELRKGDKVSVTGTVKYTPDKGERVFVKIDGTHEELWTEQSAVKLVQAAFKIGDEVYWAETGKPLSRGVIQSIDDFHAWINMGGGDYCTRTFSSINRCESKPDESLALANAHLDGYPVEPSTAAGSLD